MSVPVPAPPSPTAAAARPQRADIQALRALAVVLVLAYHLWPSVVPGGYVGVDAFFVISGFLITGQLAKEAASGGISLRRFWIRRARRLLPSSLLVLGLSGLATLLFVARRSWEQHFREIAASALYVENWLLAHDSVDYLASVNRPSLVQHYWTLSMEEQFYIALPLLLVGALACRFKPSRLPHLLALIALASLAYSVHRTAADAAAAYFVTTTRAWEFAAGGLLATAGWRAPRRLRGAALGGGLALIVLAGLLYGEATPFPGYHALVPVLGAGIVIWATQSGGLAGRLLALRPVQWTGDVSYALYLWHWPLVLLVPLWLGELDWARRLSIAVLAFVLAGLTTRFVERPIRERPIVAGTGRAVLLWSTGGAAIVLAIAAHGLREIRIERDAMARLAGESSVADPRCFGAAAMRNRCPPATAIVPDPDLVVYDQANRGECWSNNGDSTLRICTVGPARGSRRLLAVGDSHNNALLSAYAWIGETAGWRIDVAGKGGCYLTTATLRENPQYRAECREWLRQLRRHLRRSDPYDALIVTHNEGFGLRREEGDPFETEVAGLVGAWTDQAARGARIVAIKDVPKMPQSVLECVERHRLAAPQECSAPREEAYPARDSQSEAVRLVKASRLVDLGDLYCAERCSPVIGGVAVYQSDGHLTATFARTLAPYLLLELRDALD